MDPDDGLHGRLTSAAVLLDMRFQCQVCRLSSCPVLFGGAIQPVVFVLRYRADVVVEFCSGYAKSLGGISKVE